MYRGRPCQVDLSGPARVIPRLAQLVVSLTGPQFAKGVPLQTSADIETRPCSRLVDKELPIGFSFAGT